MNDPVEAVRPLIRTRQYREYTSEPVSEDQIRAIAEVARWTGSAGNWQPWRLTIVRDVPLIRQVAEIALPQTRSLQTAMAAIAISLPSDPEKVVVTTYDEGRCAERILIAASTIGLGAGIGWIYEKFRAEIQGLLGIPDDRFVRTIIAVGHPTDSARAPRSQPGEARLPLDDLVTWLD
jgi:nitroreductase